jgi:HlyD family secretion protein
VLRLQADVERVRVELTDARQKLTRAEALAREQLIASSDLDVARTTVLQAEAAVKSAQAQVVQAQASLHQAQVNLGHTTITAPIDGIVVSRSVDVGQTVAASMQAPTLFVLAGDLTRMQVNASVDEADIGRITPGLPVTFTVDAHQGDTFDGTVRQVRLEPVVTQNVVSYVTVIDVGNPEQKLKPGMTASVSIEVARADDVLRVPTAALRFRGPAGASTAGDAAAKGPAVWVQGPDGLSRVPVELGISDGTIAAVTGGALDDGARVVTGTNLVAASPGTASTSPLIPQRPSRARSSQVGGAAGGGTR